MEFISIPAIAIICYLLAELFKLIFSKNTKAYKGIPIFVGFVGGIIGLVSYVINPEIMNNSPNALVAISIGIISGLASTGCNQIIKQLLK